MRTEYEALLDELAHAKAGKEARRLHKRLKKYGNGVPFMYRYPYLPLVISIVALLLVVTSKFLFGTR